MIKIIAPFIALMCISFSALTRETPTLTGKYFDVIYPPSAVKGELKLGVNFTLWIPDGVKTLRGVIVHQHGCGEGACKGGETAAYDLHWQALARKWDCALMGPSYKQAETQNCGWWCDPENGSDKAFQNALTALATNSAHPELDRVPWCLWGHSGGAIWAGAMLKLHPERCVAVWLRSGAPAAKSYQKPGEEISAAILEVPVACNVGAKEKEGRFAKVWTNTLPFFKELRSKNAPIFFAPDPRTSHECGDQRYLAIPFFDVCLAQRLPAKKSDSQKLTPMDPAKAWLAPLEGDTAVPAADYKGEPKEANWLPDVRIAKAWSEFVKTGATSDDSAPAAPFNLRVTDKYELSWEAEVDFESGLAAFVIERNDKELARLPEKPAGPFGRPLFQRMSYHDTPEKPLPQMRYKDATAKDGEAYTYRIYAINGVGIRSDSTAVAAETQKAPVTPEK